MGSKNSDQSKLKEAIEHEMLESQSMGREFSIWRCTWMASKSIIIFSALVHFISELLLFVIPTCLYLIFNSPGLKSSNGPTLIASDWTRQENDTCPASTQSFLPFSLNFPSDPHSLLMLMILTSIVQYPMKKYHDRKAAREGIRLKSTILSVISEKSVALKENGCHEGDFMYVHAIQLVNFFLTVLYAWGLPIQVICCLLFLCTQLGQAGAFGCMLVFFLVPIQYCLGRLVGNKQDHIMDTAEFQNTNETLEHILLLKKYGWQDLFFQQVVWLKWVEKSMTWPTFIAPVLDAIVSNGITISATVFTFVMYYFLESAPLTLGKVFSSIIIFMILANQLFFVAYIIACTENTRTAMSRLRDYFLLTEIFNEDIILKQFIILMMRNCRYMECLTFHVEIRNEVARRGFQEEMVEPIVKILIDELYIVKDDNGFRYLRD